MKTIQALIFVCIVAGANAVFVTCLTPCALLPPAPVCSVHMTRYILQTWNTPCELNCYNTESTKPDYYYYLHDGACKAPAREIPQWQDCNDVSPGKSNWTAIGIPMPVDLSPSLCMAACLQFNVSYNYYGLQNGNICKCGMAPEAVSATSGCNVQCSGQHGYSCGGPNRQDTYISMRQRRLGAGGLIVDPSLGAFVGCYLTSTMNSVWKGRTKFAYPTTDFPMRCDICLYANAYYAVDYSRASGTNATKDYQCSCGDILPTSGKVADSLCNGECGKGVLCGSTDGLYTTLYGTLSIDTINRIFG